MGPPVRELSERRRCGPFSSAALRGLALILGCCAAACRAGVDAPSTDAGIGPAASDAGGETDAVIADLRARLQAAETAGDEASQAGLLFDLADEERLRSNPDAALANFARAAELARRVDDQHLLGLSLNGTGLVYRLLNRPDSALHFFEASLAILTPQGDAIDTSDAVNNVGLVHLDVARGHQLAARTDSAHAHYARALDAFREALALSRGADDAYGIAQTLKNIGVVRRFTGQRDSALAAYRHAHAIDRQRKDSLEEAMTLHNIALIHDDAARADSAIAGFRAALELFRAHGDVSWQGEAAYELARMHAYRIDPPDRATALAYYDSAAAAVAALGGRAGGDANRIAIGDWPWQLRLFEEWAITLSDLEGDGPSAALAAAERGRARALLALMRGAAPPPAPPASSASDLGAEGTALARRTAQRGPVLAYFVTRGVLLRWLIAADGTVTAARVPVGLDSIANLVASARQALGAGDASAGARMASIQRGLGSETVDPLRWTRAAETLSRLLLPDEIGRWLPTGSTLTIVPHGPLGLVPFAALPFGGELLGARFGVNYAPSLATLIAAEERRPARVSDAPLVVGNPLMPSATLAGEVLALRPLPGAESEARWVSNLLRTEALLGGDATEEAVAARLPAATLIHLATHGYAYGSDARVRESFVALAPGAGQDGVLTLGEILDALPPLRAELVVLSACQTGLGDLRFAEGVVGLQRGLLARGARSVLVSLWNVDDDATAELMRGFYLHWTEDRDQPSKAEALRRAQAEVRAMPGFEHPRFWAAFQLVGAR